MPTRWIAIDFGGPEVLRQVPVELPSPDADEVTISIRASGMNPADYKHFAPGQDPALLPLSIGYEAAGVITAVGPKAVTSRGPWAVGDEVVTYQILGGYASAITANAADVFPKPENLSFAEAANLLLVGTTAAEMLGVTGVQKGDLVVVHGAAGGVGTSVLQQAGLVGAKVIGTASESDFTSVMRFGGIPVTYGPGLQERVLAAAGGAKVDAALDCVGTTEAINVSLAVVTDKKRIVSIVAFDRAGDGIQLIGSMNPDSAPFRAATRTRILDLARKGQLEVPIAQTYPLSDAPEAVAALMGAHPFGKLALVA